VLDPYIGVEFLHAKHPRFLLAHHDIVEQGKMVEQTQEAVGNSEEIFFRFT
jgi:hypothetical protein